MTTRSYIEICYICNSNCISCPCPASWQKAGILPFKKLKEYLDKNTGYGSVVNINGGEPTIHPDFIKIVQYAHGHGARVGVLTNGRKFANRWFAENAVKAGLDDVCIAFHSSNKKSYEAFTRAKGSFNEVFSGVKNLCRLKSGGYPISIVLKILICKSTVKDLPETIRFIARNFPDVDTILLEAMDIVCSAEENKGKTLISLTQAAPLISQAVTIGIKNSQNIQLRYIPPCIFPNPESYYRLLICNKQENHNILGLKRYIENSQLDGTGVKPPWCKECKADNICPGVWKSYEEVVGLHELKPIKILKKPGFLGVKHS
ncbi:MAG: radical SAM protein [Planctomycetes bacterium]|nr:radical SAM protein [Planctomycetota bacterium]